MIQLIHIGESYYSVNGILGIHPSKPRVFNDIFPWMIKEIERVMEESESEGRQLIVKQIDLQNMSQYAIEIDHMDSDAPLVIMLPNDTVKNIEDAKLFQQYFADRISVNEQGIIETTEWIEDFGRRHLEKVAAEKGHDHDCNV